MINELDNNIVRHMQKGKYRDTIRLFSKPFDYKEFLFLIIILRLSNILSNENVKKIFLSVIFLFYFKNFFKRLRPFIVDKTIRNRSKSKLDYHSFPSGHAYISFLLASILYNKYQVPVIYIVPILVGYSRVYLGVHYPSDVIFGFIFSFIYDTIYDEFLS